MSKMRKLVHNPKLFFNDALSKRFNKTQRKIVMNGKASEVSKKNNDAQANIPLLKYNLEAVKVNLVVVDDIEVHIGNNVMVAPNVTLSVTGHPVDPEYRRGGTQFSLPIVIGDDVWIGANSVILPGVTIGDNSVIGAGSVVTQDIPANSVAYGVPCRVIREINDYDKEYYRKGKKVNLDW